MPDEGNLDVLIRTGLADPIAISLAKSLLQEAGIPFFTMDENPAAGQEGGDPFRRMTIRVPQEREAEAREILLSIEEMKQTGPDLGPG